MIKTNETKDGCSCNFTKSSVCDIFSWKENGEVFFELVPWIDYQTRKDSIVKDSKNRFVKGEEKNKLYVGTVSTFGVPYDKEIGENKYESHWTTFNPK